MMCVCVCVCGCMLCVCVRVVVCVRVWLYAVCLRACGVCLRACGVCVVVCVCVVCMRHPELKVSTPAHTKHLGWYLDFEFRVMQAWSCSPASGTSGRGRPARGSTHSSRSPPTTTVSCNNALFVIAPRLRGHVFVLKGVLLRPQRPPWPPSCRPRQRQTRAQPAGPPWRWWWGRRTVWPRWRTAAWRSWSTVQFWTAARPSRRPVRPRLTSTRSLSVGEL